MIEEFQAQGGSIVLPNSFRHHPLPDPQQSNGKTGCGHQRQCRQRNRRRVVAESGKDIAGGEGCYPCGRRLAESESRD